MERPVEGRALVVEKVEKYERLQDLAEIGRAHQTCDGAVRLATGAPNDRPRQTRRRRLSWVCGCGVHFHFCICQMVRTTLPLDGQSKASLPRRASGCAPKWRATRLGAL